MAEIHKITKNGQTILPATTTDAVVHPELQTPLTSLINEYNVSVLFPTSGIDGTNKYDLQTAINLLDEKLAPEQKTVGIKVAFYTNDLNILGTTYTYIGDTFTDINSWGGNVVQELGNSENAVVSQKAVTTAVYDYNVSKWQTNQNTEDRNYGTNKFTPSQAVAATPSYMKTLGSKITFFNEYGNCVTYQCVIATYGNSWTWKQISGESLRFDSVWGIENLKYIDAPTTTTDDFKNKSVTEDGKIIDGNYDLVKIDIPQDEGYCGISLNLRQNKEENINWYNYFSVIRVFLDENGEEIGERIIPTNADGSPHYFDTVWFHRFPRGAKSIVFFQCNHINTGDIYYNFSYCFIKEPYLVNLATGVKFGTDYLEKEIDELGVKIKDYVPIVAENKALNYVDGRVRDANGWGCTDFMSTNDADYLLTVAYYTFGYPRQTLCCFYDKDKTFIKAQTLFMNRETKSYLVKNKIPENAKYYRVNYILNSVWASQFNEPWPGIVCRLLYIDNDTWKKNENFYDLGSFVSSCTKETDTNITDADISNLSENYITTELIPCKKGDIFQFSDNDEFFTVGYKVIFDEDYNILEYITGAYYNTYEVTTENAAYIQFFCEITKHTCIKKISNINDRSVLGNLYGLSLYSLTEKAHIDYKSRLKAQYGSVTQKYFVDGSTPFITLNPDNAQKGLIISDDGEIAVNNNFALSEYISIPDGVERISIISDNSLYPNSEYTIESGASSYIGFYDSQKKPLAICVRLFDKTNTRPFMKNGEIQKFAVPENAAYFIVYLGKCTDNGTVLSSIYPIGYRFDNVVSNTIKDAKNSKRFRITEYTNGVINENGIDTSVNTYKVSWPIVIPSGSNVLTLSMIENENWPGDIGLKTANYSTVIYFYDAGGKYIEEKHVDGYFTNKIVNWKIPASAKYFIGYLGENSSGRYYPMYYQFNQFDAFQIVDEFGDAMFDVTEYIDNYVNSVYNGVVKQVQENSNNIEILKNQIESIQYTPPFKDYTDDLIRFSVEINVNKMKKVGDNTLLSEDTYSVGHDWGILRLPANYSPSGKPVPLIISCHGATGHITETEGDIEINGYRGQLIRMGFAVMDMNGLPEEYAPRNYDEMHYGCPITLRCYIKGYEWVIRNYNIKRDGCFVEGASMGGMSSIQIAACKEIPILAYAGFCPAMDTFKQPYCNPWDSASRARSEIAFLFGFDGTDDFSFSTGPIPNENEINLFKNNISKVLGYYPIFKHLVSGDVNTIFDVIPGLSDVENAEEQSVYDKFAVDFDVPVKIWHNWDDSTIRCRYSKYFCEMITRGGGIAYFRPFPSGGHNAWDNGQKNNVLTDINGQQFSVSVSVYEKYLWYQRWLVNGDNNENSKQNPPL